MNLSPKKTDSIAILGAGPSGIHMAHLLKQRGFERIVLLEKSDRIAGKSLSVVYKDGVPHEMGSCYLHSGYTKLMELIRELDLDAPIKPGGPNGDRDMFAAWADWAKPPNLREWLLREIEEINVPEWLEFLPDAFQLPSLLKAIERYKELHRNLLGSLVTEAMPQELSQDRLDQIDCTFIEFLEQNQLSVLAPLFLVTNAAQGYGLLETVPALYGLWWNTPELLDGFRNSRNNPDRPWVTMLPNGFQEIWETLVKKDQLNIELKVSINSIKRPDTGKIILEGLKDQTSKKWEVDYLILACNLPMTQNILDSREIEKKLFAAMRTAQLTTTLVAAKSEPERQCIGYWPQFLRVGRSGRVYCRRSSRSSIRPNLPLPEIDEFVVYQYDDHYRPEREEILKRQLLEDLQGIGMTKIKILEQHVWPYFTQFTADAIQSRYPWKLKDIQGSFRTWYIGASACFESIHDVISYNHALINRVLSED